MKKKILFQLLPTLFLLPALSGCEAIGAIFKTGVGVGIFIAVFILVIVVVILGRAKK